MQSNSFCHSLPLSYNKAVYHWSSFHKGIQVNDRCFYNTPTEHHGGGIPKARETIDSVSGKTAPLAGNSSEFQ